MHNIVLERLRYEQYFYIIFDSSGDKILGQIGHNYYTFVRMSVYNCTIIIIYHRCRGADQLLSQSFSTILIVIT